MRSAPKYARISEQAAAIYSAIKQAEREVARREAALSKIFTRMTNADKLEYARLTALYDQQDNEIEARRAKATP